MSQASGDLLILGLGFYFFLHKDSFMRRAAMDRAISPTSDGWQLYHVKDCLKILEHAVYTSLLQSAL